MKKEEVVNSSLEKMDLRSMDVGADNRARLKALFPSVFTESQNEKGEPIKVIDFEKLKAELGSFSNLFEARRERYGMDWPGKKDCMKLIQQPSLATLKPCREESVRFDDTENLFIEGDNLEVLKLLQKSYYGRVKMIYIDPPYNTGKEFIYPDNYSETLDTYLAYAGLADDKGRKFSTNTPNEGRFHTKWLNMMYPRLYLARNLLREDGVMFISIDDGEVSNLRKLCDEIFGEENFLAMFIWKSRKFTDARSSRNISTDHEYILAYSRNNTVSLVGRPRDESKYSNPDNDPRGPWMSRSMLGLATQDQRPNLHYSITDPDTEVIYDPPETTGWRYAQDRMHKLIEQNRILFPKTPKGRPREKKFRSDIINEFTSFPTIIDKIHTSHGTAVVRDIFGAQIFDFPKPSELIKQIVQQTTGNMDCVLDFFSGSCSTAHAVLDLNKEDAGHRKFIMVQLPEPCDEKSEAFKAGYKTIADIGKERIRRVIQKIEGERATKVKKAEGMLPGMAEELPDIDLGFKVLKLDKSNFKIWGGGIADSSKEEIARQLELHIDHIDSNATQEDILFELLLKAGFMPTEKVEKRELAGKTLFSMAEGALLICLENEITPELINAVAEAEPSQFICLDRGFLGNDQLKANAVQTFAARNQRRDKAEQIFFRTV